ncbi:MAG: alpha/beta hydrolase [Intrasporangiaceae bacterium]|nr:alpha/beta hydrolase [Intrasporangiaceae bacterium]
MKGNVTGREWTETVNGTGLRVEEAGAGEPPVVFSPALFTNRQLFDAPFTALKAHHRCIRYDHRGQGDSGLGGPQPSNEVLGTEGLYEDALALLNQLEVESCHWVGASVGGFVGVRLAARHPERIRSLTLIGFSMRRVTPADLRMIDVMGTALRLAGPLGPIGAWVRARVTERVMTNMFGTSFMADPSRDQARQLWRRRFAPTLTPAALPMLRQVFGHPGNPPELLARVQAPTLLISGEDELMLVDEAERDPVLAQHVIPDGPRVTETVKAWVGALPEA